MSVVTDDLPPPTRIDIGCGKNKKAGFIGCDSIAFEGVDKVFNAGADKWPFEDSSVTEANASHFLEHLTNFEGRWERVHFFNELYRVLAHDSGCLITIPHWGSQRYYGDPTHKEPFSEFGWYYLDRSWRKINAPHADKEFNPNGYDCDFACTWGYNLHQQLLVHNQDYQQHAMQFWMEARQDMICTAKARKV